MCVHILAETLDLMWDFTVLLVKPIAVSRNHNRVRILPFTLCICGISICGDKLSIYFKVGPVSYVIFYLVFYDTIS